MNASNDSSSPNDGPRRPHRRRPSARSNRHRDGSPTQARRVAFQVLQRVETAGAYADLALHAALQRNPLSPADRALTTELVYGTLRQRGNLDYRLGSALDGNLTELEPLVRSALRLGAYQIFFTDRIPAEVAVDESVRCIKNAGATRAAGLVNAVLRRLAREGDGIALPPLDEDPEAHLVHALSIPSWIARRWIDQFGPEEAAEIARAQNGRPLQTVRVNPQRDTRDDLLAELRERFPNATPCPFAPFGIRLGESGNAAADPAFREGRITIQDEASQLVTHLLDPQPGDRVLDTCAAPGTKATAIAERVGKKGVVLALDRHPRRLGLVTRDARRLGLENIRVAVQDAAESLEDLTAAPVDRALVDAPCSGLGTLRRNPDARWRIRPEDPARLASLQLAILKSAAAVLRPGGTLVYSTCTITKEENEAVIDAFLLDAPDFSLVEPERLPNFLRPLVDARGFLHTYPHRHQCDGFFAARLEKNA